MAWPIRHHLRDSLEAYLIIVFAILATSGAEQASTSSGSTSMATAREIHTWRTSWLTGLTKSTNGSGRPSGQSMPPVHPDAILR